MNDAMTKPNHLVFKTTLMPFGLCRNFHLHALQELARPVCLSVKNSVAR